MNQTLKSVPATPSRVLFYGVTGSGKSSAAHAYAAASGLPGCSADDDIGWLPGWQQRSVDQQRLIAADVAGRDRWVLDSAYGLWRDIIVPRADLIVALDYPRWLSLFRLLCRSLQRIITKQPVCNGNVETLGRLLTRDSIFYWHFSSFARKKRLFTEWQSNPDMPPVIVFRRPKDLNDWLAQVTPAVAGQTDVADQAAAEDRHSP
ncbi:adenylate kinase [Arthrobacter sp. ISL-72]|nr:adenylate kinase [Arthrobacter sp. ISL-72]